MTPRVVALLVFAATAAAQTSPQAEIEVASVKANKTANNGIGNRFGPLTMSWTNASLKTLIGAAYHVPGYRLAGASGWMDSQRWDIDAKLTLPTGMDQKLQLMQSLLADRFHLKCHWETRELPLYRLVVSAGGPKFKESTADERGGITPNRGSISGKHTEISNFVFFLAGELQETIIDETGLTGQYTIDLRWTPEDVTASAANDPPNLLAAIDQQLGLKLKASRGPVDVLVVDQAQRPNEN